MKTSPLAIACLAAIVLPSSAIAHSGHGSLEAASALHYLVDHPLLATLALSTIALAGLKRSRKRQ